MTKPTVLAVGQAFKGSLSANAVSEALRAGISDAGAAARVLVGSDGGDGLLDALEPLERRRSHHPVRGPRRERIEAPVAWLDDATAAVESRHACGLSLVPPERRDPERTTTRGVGELIEAAVGAGAQTVYVGLGGSATMDGGVGMARVWGWLPRGNAGEPLADAGEALERLATLDQGRRPGAAIIGLADVRNALTGADGAVRYAAQKGASAIQAGRLALGLDRLVEATRAWNGPALAAQVGAGAAGGLGFGILCFAGGRLQPGASWVLDRIGWAEALVSADLVVTGEGAFDATSLAGKLTGEVLRRAQEAGIPAALVAPRVDGVPAGVTVETGGGIWSVDDLRGRVARAVGRALRLPPA